VKRSRPGLLTRLLPTWFHQSSHRHRAGVWSLRTLIITAAYLFLVRLLGPRDIVSHVLSPTGGLSQVGSLCAALTLVTMRLFLVALAGPLLLYKWILALWPIRTPVDPAAPNHTVQAT
jgi:hypothetical protein